MSESEQEKSGSESNIESQEPSSSRKRKAYSTEKKLETVDYAKKYSKNSAARKFNISRSRVQEWVSQEKQLRESQKGSKRLAGAGRHLSFAELDDELAKWVREQRAEKKKVSRRIIRQQAIKMFVRDDNEKEFKSSIGWLQKFMDRHKFRARLPTTVCQKPPVEYEQVLVNIVMFVSQLREKNKYAYILACDETAVWLDPSGGKCIAEKGAKEVSVLTTGHDKLTTGHDKLRVTVMLTARSDGFKCRPYVLLPRKRVDPVVANKFKSKLHLMWEGTTWMNDQLTEDYLTHVVGQFPFGKRLLVWDSFRPHISESTKKKLKWCGVDTAVVPGGCTKFIQAPDVSWNAPFKANVRQLYEDWTMHGEKEFTSGGKPKAAPMAIYLQWIVDAWESITKELIIKSFKACGITNAMDGSEDDEIHCFKVDGPVPTGRAKLQQAREEKELAELFEEIDLEQEEENDNYDSDTSLEC